ncbi:glucose-regulated protein 78-like protein, partial [Leptotrombidium deliense]
IFADKKYIVAITMGAAYFNVCVASVLDNCTEILEMWDENIGGRNFDIKCHDSLFEYPKGKISKTLRTKLLLKCEEARIKLTTEEKCEITADHLCRYFKNGWITQGEYESICAKLVATIKRIIIEATTKATSMSKDVHVIVNGYATRLSPINELIKNMNTFYYDDEDLSRGAAIYSAHKINDQNASVTVKNFTRFIYKIEVKDRPSIFIKPDRCLPVNTIIEIPCCKDYQQKFEIKIYEGENTKNNEICDSLIFTLNLKLDTFVKKGAIAVTLTLNIDDSGILSLCTQNCDSKVIKSWRIASSLTKPEVVKITERCNQRLNLPLIEKWMTMKKLRDTVNGHIEMLQDIKLNNEKFDVCKIKNKLHSILEWVKENHNATEIVEKQKEIESMVNHIFNTYM